MVFPYKEIGLSGLFSSQYLPFFPIPYPEFVVKNITLFFFVVILQRVLIDVKFVLTASFLNFLHKGAPTKAARGII